MQLLDQSLPFKIICDVSNYTIEVVLGQKRDNQPYASHTLDEAQINYDTTEKELLVVPFTLDKIQSYLVSYKVIMFIDHTMLKYLLNKKRCQVKTNLIDCILTKV